MGTSPAQALRQFLSTSSIMTIRTRIDNFQGSDSEYIIYLERKVTQLTRPHSPPSSPQADVGDKLRFVPFEPGTLATCGKTTPNRWQNEMDKMLGSFPGDGDWSSKRESTGLSTESKLLLAFDIITGISMPSVKPTTVGSNLLAPAELDTAFRLVGGYAKSVAAMNTEKVFTTQIVNFCNVIFVSQCCVLLHQGVEASRVDDLMKICISKSDPKNLGVLRRGAIWVNRMIRVLAGDGLGQRASEAFVLCGETVAQYGRFADAGENGFSYFRKSVQARGFNESNAHTFLPFWIPFFIKTILGDVYSLFDICDALGYDETSKMGGYSEWLESYRSRKVLLPNAVLAGGYRNHQEAEDSLPNPAPKRRRKSTRPIPKRKRQLAGPGLKRKSKSFEPADRRQLQGSSRADPLRCLDPDPEDVSHSDSRVPHEDHAMHALLTAVDHAVSCEQDQQLGGVTGVSGSLDWDGLDSRGQVESNSLQQLCVVSNTNTSAFGNAFMPACQISEI